MKIALFCHTLRSDWNHGNAHFLRGVVTELCARGHRVRVHEPADAWSLERLRADHGEAPVAEFHHRFPAVDVHPYDPGAVDEAFLDRELAEADLVWVHEWNEPRLVAAVGAHRLRGGRYALLFHDTHHRAVTEPDAMGRYDLSGYDGVLAFGAVLRDLYLHRGWAARAWVWHEAADVRVFRPLPAEPSAEPAGDLVWIGNWGDEERSEELREFLLEPVVRLALTARVHGVRYPEAARAELARAGVAYEGWLANARVPEVFARHRVTVHVPRRPYVEALPGIPTIRPFEALACGIPLVCAPWHDAEGLFTPGEDYLVAENGRRMTEAVRCLLAEPDRARALAEHGRRTLLARHTCGHRVDELLTIADELGLDPGGSPGEAGADAPVRKAGREVTV
jgi:spore maturation protein CgeB